MMGQSDLCVRSYRRARGRVSRPVTLLAVLVAFGSLLAFGLLTYSRLDPRSTSASSQQTKRVVGSDPRSTDSDTLVNSEALPDFPETQLAKQLQEEIAQGLNPRDVGWQTEAFNDAASRQLKRLAQMLASPLLLAEGPPPDLLADDFGCQMLRPKELEIIFQDSSTTVSRPTKRPTERPTSARRHPRRRL